MSACALQGKKKKKNSPLIFIIIDLEELERRAVAPSLLGSLFLGQLVRETLEALP